MTIASEITRINNNIAAAYTACNNKGATMPQTQNSANLATAISSIPSGGGSFIGIPREVSSQGVYQQPNSSFTFTLPSNVTDLSDYSLVRAFYLSGITSIDLSSLTTLTGSYSLQNVCAECNNLTYVDLSGLKIIDLKSFGYTFEAAFNRCMNLTNVDLSNLETITSSYDMGGYVFSCCFQNTKLSSFTFNKLKTIRCNYALDRMFSLCNNLTTVRFPLLNVIQQTPSGFTSNGFCLYRIFRNCRNLSDVYFNSLTTQSFGSLTNQFQDMLSSTGTTVTHTLHFPSNLQSTISGLTGYPLFGGTSGYVVCAFDLDPTE